MFRYKSVLKKFLGYCNKETDSIKRREMFNTIVDILPEKYLADFLIDVRKTIPLVTDPKIVIQRIIDSHNVEGSVKILEANIGSEYDFARNITNVAYFGNDQDCFKVIKKLGESSNFKQLSDFKLNQVSMYELMHAFYIMDLKVLSGKNPEYNYELACLQPNSFIKDFIRRNEHIDKVIDSKKGEYLSKLIYEYNLIERLPGAKVDQIVDLLSDKKYTCADKYDALLFIRHCKGEKEQNFCKLYDSLIDKNNPLYTLKVMQNPALYHTREAIRIRHQQRLKEYDDMNTPEEEQFRK